MKKWEKEQLQCDIRADIVITGQGVWECLSKLEYKMEQSKCLNDIEIKELIRKLTIVKNSVDRTNESVNKYFTNKL